MIDAAGVANHLSAFAIDPRPVEVVIADIQAIGEIAIQLLVADHGAIPLENVVVLDDIAFVTDEGNVLHFGVLLQPTSLAGVDVGMTKRVVLRVREDRQREVFRPVFLRINPVGCNRCCRCGHDSILNELPAIDHG